MWEFSFIALYGILAVIGSFLFLFWGIVAGKRLGTLAKCDWYRDRYYLLAGSIAITSFGTAVLFGTRALGNLFYGFSRISYGWEGFGIMTGISTILAGKVLLVWLADLEKSPPVWRWTAWMVTLSLLWVVAAWYFVPLAPLVDAR